MGVGLVALYSQDPAGSGIRLVSVPLEREKVRVAVIADIGVAAVSHGEVDDQVAHQCRGRARGALSVADDAAYNRNQ